MMQLRMLLMMVIHLLVLLLLLRLLLLLVVTHDGRNCQPVLGEMRMGAHDIHIGSARISTRPGVGAIAQRTAAGEGGGEQRRRAGQ